MINLKNSAQEKRDKNSEIETETARVKSKLGK